MDLDRIDWDLDYEDDVDAAEFEDDVGTLAEDESEIHLSSLGINVLVLDPAALG